MRRADRLIGITHFLRSRRRAVTAAQIADAFDICTRTVYRDISDLMMSGVPISGEAGVGYLIDKAFYLPPIAFDADELEAIGLGISMVHQCTDERFAEAAARAFAKIQAVLPAARQGEMDQITTFSMPGEPLVPRALRFSDVRECIRAKRRMTIRYTDGAAEETERTVRPLALIFWSPVWLLATWCEKRDAFRNFRLDRIAAAEMNGAVFADEPGKDLAAYRAQEEACGALGPYPGVREPS